MKVIPAIDIKDGKVVRLTQGMADKVTVYSEDPVEVAKRWASFGADLIHIVDLDGALQGSLKNFDVIKRIAGSIQSDIEVGGGIRDVKTIEMVLGAGIDKVCIGTKALDMKFLEAVGKNFKHRIVVSVDAKNGTVYSKGWLYNTRMSAINLAKEAEAMGITTINYTDIARDGMLEGPNIRSLKELLKSTHLDVVASGGISSIEDVKKLQALEKDGLMGMIIGKALYEDKIDLAEAIKICSQNE